MEINNEKLQKWYEKRITDKLVISYKDYRKGVNSLKGESETLLLKSLEKFPEATYNQLCNAFFNAHKGKKLLQINES